MSPDGVGGVVAGDHVGAARALEEDDRLEQVRIEAAGVRRGVHERAVARGAPRGRDHAARALGEHHVTLARRGVALERRLLVLRVGQRVIAAVVCRPRARASLAAAQREGDPHRAGDQHQRAGSARAGGPARERYACWPCTERLHTRRADSLTRGDRGDLQRRPPLDGPAQGHRHGRALVLRARVARPDRSDGARRGPRLVRGARAPRAHPAHEPPPLPRQRPLRRPLRLPSALPSRRAPGVRGRGRGGPVLVRRRGRARPSRRRRWRDLLRRRRPCTWRAPTAPSASPTA